MSPEVDNPVAAATVPVDSAAPAAEATAPSAEGGAPLLMQAQQTMPGQARENRASQRVRVRLRAVLITEHNGTRKRSHGQTVDLSGSGLSFVTRYDLTIPQTGTIYVMAEQGDDTHPAAIIEAQCRLVNSVLSSRQGGFRLGIALTRILGDGEKVLKQLLKSKQPAVPGG